MELSITNIIIGITCIVSYLALQDRNLFNKLMFYPYRIDRNKENERWLTGGFVHGDFGHLLFNMMSLYFFGNPLEQFFKHNFPLGSAFYVVFYLLAIICASVPSFNKNRNNPGYTAIGASGAVSAVIFAIILIAPWTGIGIMFIPIPIPGFIFGFLYLAYSNWASRNSHDNIGHDTHFWGSVFGFVLPIVLRPSLFIDFIEKMKSGF